MILNGGLVWILRATQKPFIFSEVKLYKNTFDEAIYFY